MTATPDTPPAPAPAAPASPAPNNTAAAIAVARQRLADGKSLLDDTPDTPGEATATTTVAAASAEEAGPADLTITLPGMDERGEAALELEAPDQETYERLNRLTNEATIGREVKAERHGVADLRRQLTEVEDLLAQDPSGFALQRLPERTRLDLAMSLMFEQPDVLETVQQRLRDAGYEGGVLEVIESPDAMRTLSAELKASRLEMRDRLSQQHAQHRTMQQSAQRVLAEIERLIPESVTGEQRELLFRDAVRDVKDRVQRLGLTEIDPQDVAMLVAQRLRGHRAITAPRRSTPAVAPASRAARPAAPAELPAGTAARIKLAKEIGLEALLDRARATTT